MRSELSNYKGEFFMGHKSTSLLLFILYLVLLGVMFAKQSMVAMWLMTAGMLIESSVNLYDQFRRH